MEDLSRGDTEKFGGCLQNACEEFHGVDPEDEKNGAR